MTELHYHLLDVFTDRPFGGNQLAVFPAAPALSGRLMQQIARELNLSETVFVRPPTSNQSTHQMRIFTPGVELPFAGHPTIGTAIVLAALTDAAAPSTSTFVLEQGAGPVPVRVTRLAEGAWEARLIAPRLPEHGAAAPASTELALMLGLSPDDIVTGDRGPVTCSAGVPFTFIPLTTVDALVRARLDVARWKMVLSTTWAPHVYCFTPTGPVTVRARMFAPAMGIEEDPATGGGAVALAGYLSAHHPHDERTVAWTIEQGIEVGRPSRLFLEADRRAGRITEVRLGGSAVIMGEGTLRLASIV